MNNKTIWKTAAAVLLLILVVSSVIWMAGRDNRTEPPEESASIPVSGEAPEESEVETVSEAEQEEESSEAETEEETSAPEKPENREEESLQEPEETELEEEPYQPPVLAVVSDIHYQSHSITDFGKAYYDFIAGGDGKVVHYLPELLEAFIDEMIALEPDAVVFSGDITMNGEIENHQELSQKLDRLQASGIQVLVIPGNHDINNPNAARYFGNEKTKGQPITPEEFCEFYRGFGYDQAVSRDPASLSYLYPLDEKYWLLMLDTCQYEPVNLVGGRIREETLVWMDEQLEAASEAGVTVIPVGHHNLLPESSLYTTDCALESYQEIVDYMESWHIPLYISGHLHVQRLKKHDGSPLTEERLGPGPRIDAKREAQESGEERYGIYEIVSDAVSIPPCQYGIIRWDEEGNMTYQTRRTDVSAWAANNGIENPDLLDFERYSREYIKKLISRQIENKMEPVSMRFLDDMTGLYADLYQDYYAGKVIDAKAVYGSLPWQWWMRLLPNSRQVREMRAMVGDSEQDNNYLYLPAEAALE